MEGCLRRRLPGEGRGPRNTEGRDGLQCFSWPGSRAPPSPGRGAESDSSFHRTAGGRNVKHPEGRPEKRRENRVVGNKFLGWDLGAGSAEEVEF